MCKMIKEKRWTTYSVATTYGIPRRTTRAWMDIFVGNKRKRFLPRGNPVVIDSEGEKMIKSKLYEREVVQQNALPESELMSMMKVEVKKQKRDLLFILMKMKLIRRIIQITLKEEIVKDLI